MFLPNQHPDHRKPLDPLDAETLGLKAAEEVSGTSPTATTMRRRPCTPFRPWPPNSVWVPSM